MFSYKCFISMWLSLTPASAGKQPPSSSSACQYIAGTAWGAATERRLLVNHEGVDMMQVLESIHDRIATEPVMFMAFIEALIGVFIVFGVDLTTEQSAAILIATGSLLSLIARQKVTPTRSIQTSPASSPGSGGGPVRDVDGVLAHVD